MTLWINDHQLKLEAQLELESELRNCVAINPRTSFSSTVMDDSRSPSHELEHILI